MGGKEYLNKVMAVSEAAARWGLADVTVRHACTGYKKAPPRFTEDEVRLICRVVETETYQCDFDSKVNVANVVLNRIESGEFGETVEDVITADNQFAYGRKSITEDTILAVEYAFMMEDTTQGALFFHSNRKTDKFCGNDFIFQDEAGHNFY